MPSIYEPSPVSESDIRTVLRVNTDNAMVALVADCAAGLRIQWLEIAMDMGVFDFTDEVAARGSLERSSACIEALVQVLVHTEPLTLTHDPEFGKLAIPVQSHALSSDAKMLGPFVQRLAARLIKDREGVLSTYAFDYPGTVFEATSKNLLKSANRSLAVIMALAAALDLPQTVHAIRRSTLTAHQEGLPADWLGQGFKAERIHPTRHLEVTPAFFAIFYSSTSALKAFAPNPHQPLKEKSVDGPKGRASVTMFIEANFDASSIHHDAVAMLNHWYPSCAPSTLALSWRESFDPAKPASSHAETDLNMLACRALYRYPGGENPSELQIPAFNAVEAFAFRPGHTICEAIENARPDYIQRFQGQVPWDDRGFVKELASALVKGIHSVRFGCPKHEAEGAIVSLMHLAVQDARQDVFFKTTLFTRATTKEVPGETIVQPVFALIEAQFNRGIVGFLENGLNPVKPMAHGALSPLDLAEALQAHETANVMRSFMARQSAHSILADIEQVEFMQKDNP